MSGMRPASVPADSRPEVMPLISVVICTHNRADYLPQAIRSVLEQRMTADRYELIVVDNRSTDRTREVVRPFEANDSVRYVYDGVLGLCHARNTGWQRARGRYVAYLDDDAVAEPGWLAAIEEAFSTTPGVGVVGGRVDPIWAGARPPWLSDEISLSLTILNWSEHPKVIEDLGREWLVSANMAVPRSVLSDVGGFHPSLDRVGSRMLSSGDVFLEKQILRRGHVCLYHPKMAIRHLVPKSRLNKRWFIRRYYSQGLSDAAMQLIEDSPSRTERLRRAIALASGLLRSPRRLADLILPRDDPARFTEKCFSWITVGQIAGLLGALKK